MRTLFSVLLGAVMILALLLVVINEVERRAADSRIAAQAEQFIEHGPRFTMDNGFLLCQRIHDLEVRSGVKEPVDCEQMRRVEK